jgi:MYXO-CTERM domain-containing protein
LYSCSPAFCGDGFVRTGVEQCDDGNNISGDGCDALCKKEAAQPKPDAGAGDSGVSNPDAGTSPDAGDPGDPGGDAGGGGDGGGGGGGCSAAPGSSNATAFVLLGIAALVLFRRRR